MLPMPVPRLFIPAMILAVFCVLTITRSSIYRDEITLWLDTVAKSPAKARTHNGLGDAFQKAGRLDDARTHFEQAVEIDPNYTDALFNLSVIYNTQGRSGEALQLLERALALDPSHHLARFSLAMLYYDRGLMAEAEQEYELVLRLAPFSGEADFSRQMLIRIRTVSPSR